MARSSQFQSARSRRYQSSFSASHQFSRIGTRQTQSGDGVAIGNCFRDSTQTAEFISELSTVLLQELMSYPGVAQIWQTATHPTQHTLLLNVHLQREDLELKFFSTIATLGTPYDITLQELRIECMFPADEATERNWRQYFN
jgi:MmyB-like transcription regulator ligand binding domain